MSTRNDRLMLVAILLALFLPADWVVSQEQQAPPQSESHVDEVLSTMRQLRQQVGAWRDAIESGQELTREEMARIDSEMRRIAPDAMWILEHGRQVRRERVAAEQQSNQTSRSQSQQWVEQMHAIGEGAEATRNTAIAEIKAALQGDDPTQQLAALQTLQASGDVKFNKQPFRELVLPFVRESSGPTLVAACYALFNTVHEPGDLKLIQAAWLRRSPGLDRSMSHLLFTFSEGKIDGLSEEIVLELLDDPDNGVRREALRGLWGANVSDRLAGRIVELIDESSGSRHDAVYFGASTLKPKNEEVVDALIRVLSDPDWNNSHRALWGLGFGVPEQLQHKVVEAATEMYLARSEGRVREDCQRLIRRYGGNAAADALPK